MPVQHGLELERGGGQAGSLLDLQRELAGGDRSPCPRRRRSADRCPAIAAATRPRVRVLADVEERADGGRVERRAAQLRCQRDAHDQRRQVADGVAPALVLLLGQDHVVGQCRPRRAGPNGDQRRRDAGRSGGSDRFVRDVRAALVRDPDQQPASERPPDGVERLKRSNLAAGGQVERLGTSLAIAIAACSDVPQPVVTTGGRLDRRADRSPAIERRSWPDDGRGARRRAGSAAIISLMTYGGRDRNGGISTAPRVRAGRGAAGSASSASAASERLEDHERDDDRSGDELVATRAARTVGSAKAACSAGVTWPAACASPSSATKTRPRGRKTVGIITSDREDEDQRSAASSRSSGRATGSPGPRPCASPTTTTARARRRTAISNGSAASASTWERSTSSLRAARLEQEPATHEPGHEGQCQEDVEELAGGASSRIRLKRPVRIGMRTPRSSATSSARS